MTRLLERLEAIWKAFRPPARKRLELRCVTYGEADELLCATDEEWRIAKEEDSNRQLGFVYLERLEPMTTNFPSALTR